MTSPLACRFLRVRKLLGEEGYQLKLEVLNFVMRSNYFFISPKSVKVVMRTMGKRPKLL